MSAGTGTTRAAAENFPAKVGVDSKARSLHFFVASLRANSASVAAIERSASLTDFLEIRARCGDFQFLSGEGTVPRPETSPRFTFENLCSRKSVRPATNQHFAQILEQGFTRLRRDPPKGCVREVPRLPFRGLHHFQRVNARRWRVNGSAIRASEVFATSSDFGSRFTIA